MKGTVTNDILIGKTMINDSAVNGPESDTVLIDAIAANGTVAVA
jgi:hypothetical protein